MGLWGANHTCIKTFKSMSSRSSSLRIADILAVQHLCENRFHRSRYAVTAGCFVVCAECCHTFRGRFATLDQWLIRRDSLNCDILDLDCDVCEKRILPAKPIKIR